MRQQRLVSVLFGLALIPFAFSGIARCEESRAEVPQPRWGTTDRIFTHVGFSEFVNLLASDPPPRYYDSSTDTFGLYSTIPDGLFIAMAHVPSGALLTYLELDYCDTNTNPNVDVALYLKRCNYLGTGCTELASLSSKDRSAGCHVATFDLTSLAVTMDNNLYELDRGGEHAGGRQQHAPDGRVHRIQAPNQSRAADADLRRRPRKPSVLPGDRGARGFRNHGWMRER